MSLHPDLLEDLSKAAMWGNLRLLEGLLENGADPNFPNEIGNSPLHEAAYYGEIECVNTLLEFKADVNLRGHGGKAPLHKAVSGVLGQFPSKKRDTETKIHDNQMSIVKLLIARGADLKLTDGSGLSARELAMQCDFYECADLIDDLEKLQIEQEQLMVREAAIKDLFSACEEGDLVMLKELIPSIPEAVNDFVHNDENLLMCAARTGHLPIVEHLLDVGAVAVANGQANKTALHLACEAGHSEVVVCLLNRLPALLMIDDSPRETSLHIAARLGHVDIVRNLLAVAARSHQIKSRDSSCEEEAYLYKNEMSRVVMNDSLPEMTLEVMALTEKEKRTPLHEASVSGHVDVVKLLVDHMIQYHEATPSRGFSPLSKFNSPNQVFKKPALKQAPGIDTMTLKGRTAFHEAAKQGHFDVMKVLLQAGADINAFMRLSIDTNINTDLTPLVQACLMMRKDVVHFLLQNGATDARLKALKRTLSIPDNDIAGLLLCYNGGVREIKIPTRARKTPQVQTDKSLEKSLLEVTWKSKNLKYIFPDWLSNVTSLPEFESKPSELLQLDISSNILTNLPIEVFQLPNLKQLDVSRNQILTLPVEEGKKNCGWSCCQLSQLDVTTNQLSSLPACLFALPELKEINANGNKISFVPHSVWSAPKLTKLYLARNELSSFPSEKEPQQEEFPPMMSPLPKDSTNLDSGYRSNPQQSPTSNHIGAESREAHSFYLPYNNPLPTTKNQTFSERRETIYTQAVVSRRLESFHDTNIEVELEDIESPEEIENQTNFCLEVLDLGGNSLTSIPHGLSCLAPKLQKLTISKNAIKSLGTVSDYPFEIELIDGSNNWLHSAIAPSPSSQDYRCCLPCARKPYANSPGASQVDIFSYKPCSHRSHKNLRKLTTLKLNNNQLIDLQLFKHIGRRRTQGDLTSSFEESSVDQKSRSNTTADTFGLVASQLASKPLSSVGDMITRSMNPNIVIRSNTVGNKKEFVIKKNSAESTLSVKATAAGLNSSKTSEHSSGSREEGSGSDGTTSQLIVISPLFPQLSTLELANNRLKYVPSFIQCVPNLSCLIISHNPDIDTLPLELSNCEHLWNLEYEGCPLTNPPAMDLNKFRLASDKLLYMKSLLHDAKPNESMKLMLVGLQKMGKTTLLCRLREVNEEASQYSTFLQRVTGEDVISASGRESKTSNKIKEPLSTVGVDLGVWKYRKDLEPEFLKTRKKGSKQLRTVTFYTWDFGGQEEYYATHQCFMSSRSLYLVVWDITLGIKGIEQLEPWLHNIQARAPGSPVVIVGTHCDKLKDLEKDKMKMKMNSVIYQKFLIGRGPQQLRELGLPNIRDVIYVGCPLVGRVEGVLELRMALYDIAFSLTLPGRGQVAKMKLLEQPIPANYLKLEERVRLLSVQCKKEETPPVLKETVFRDSSNDIIVNPKELNQAVTFLHENGIMLHYDTPALGHLYFVDPQWLCDMLAHIVTVPEVNRFIQRQDGPEAGILRTSVLSHVFKGNVFPQAYRKEYVELLGKFEVALYLDRHRLLVPSMLPAKPCYTLHSFKNVFPRPSLVQILSQCPEASKLFSSSKSTLVNDRKGFELSHESIDGGSIDSQLTVATHMSEELFRTGLLLRRFYFMTYVPSGFWPRLISRFLSTNDFGKILLRSLGYDKDQIHEILDQLVSGLQNGAVSLEWSYWKTGIELWYKGVSLVRVSELLPEGAFHNCKPSPSIFEQSASNPLEPAFDAADLSFDLNGLWMPVEMTPNRGVEVAVPDTVCLANLQKELEQLQQTAASCVSQVEPRSSGPVEESINHPRYESHWMSAELMALAADYIDTLLEDWYPGLGAREGNKTVETIPYVNRIIPCPYCISKAEHFVEGEDSKLCLYQLVEEDHKEAFTDLNSTPDSTQHRSTARNSKQYSRLFSSSPPLSPDPVEGETPFVLNPQAKRALFNDSEPQMVKRSVDSTSVPSEMNNLEPLMEKEPVVTRSMSDNTPRKDMSNAEKRRPKRKGSLAAISHTRSREDSSPDIWPLASPLETALPLPKPVGSEQGLTLASKFGFMIESCILASRLCEDLVCPAHKDYPLRIIDIAPDLMFADLPKHFILDPACVDMGEYIDHGSFGDIYRGAVYPTPSATDGEGLDVAIKMDRTDSNKVTSESATKAYVEARAEVSLLHRLNHPYIIQFIGVVLQPLCYILEWASKGSLSSLFQKYRKVDARISPVALQQTAYQVASGLAYLHQHNIVYYDLKSPNLLVFEFPSAQESLNATQADGDGSLEDDVQPATEVLVKIADLGISRLLSPGGVKGFKGSPGFMAPEILKYVGMEACTEKIDVFSFGMFLFELIALHFPFEKQNLMGSQIEKLVIEGERPPLQSRELNNPILYLDVMRWCWQQDFRSRPSAQQLTEILTNPSIPHLVDAVALHNSNTVTCACICTLPIEMVPPAGDSGNRNLGSFVPPSLHTHVAQGDLNEELWLCTYNIQGCGSEVYVINFKGKASQSFPVSTAKVTCICGVSYSMWLGTEEGQVFIIDAVTKHTLLDRHLAVLPDQGIASIHHILANRQVLVTRKDGSILLFSEDIQGPMLPDISYFDNRLNSTQLPVRSVFKTPEKLPILCTSFISSSEGDKKTIWCGTKYEIVMIFDITATSIEYCRKKYSRSRYDVSPDQEISSLVEVKGHGTDASHVWALALPSNMLYCWSVKNEKLLKSIQIDQFTTETVTSLFAMRSQLELALISGRILLLNINETEVVSTTELRGHVKEIYQLLSIGGRVLPRHWLPSIIGRSNALDYYRDLLDEKDIKSITSTMTGRQTRLLVTIGYGYLGVIDRLVEPLMSFRDRQENFVLLWVVDR